MELETYYKLIVVDDEKTTCDYLSSQIENAFEQVQVVGHFYNGSMAWQFLQDHNVDCVITDIKMPLMSGLELAKLIYENHFSTKVILVSGYNDFEYAQQGIKYQVADYLLKPIDYKELAKVVSSVLEIGQSDTEAALQTFSSPSSSTENDHIINKAIEYINQNFQKQLSRDEVASALYLSPAYFGRIFKKKLGCTFSQYLTQVRMEAAVALLKSNHSVQEIAQLVGYNNIRHFTRTFKQMYGCPPREYRIRKLKLSDL